MADIQISKPVDGKAQNIPVEAGSRFVIDPDAVIESLEKSGENDLVFKFEDGSQIFLQDFYSEYDEENQPTFVLNGKDVNVQDFFASLNAEDIMPAAGGGDTGPDLNARYHEYDSMDLGTGIDHLTRLDYNSNRAFEPRVASYIDNLGDDGGYDTVRVNNPIAIVPVIPGVTPGIPDIPTGGPGYGTIPGAPGGIIPGGLLQDVLTVHERFTRGGGEQTVEGASRITAPDGLARIEIAGKVVWENGRLTDDLTVETDEGHLTVTGHDPDTGILTYTYTLTRATDEHDPNKTPGGDENISHTFPITVTDTDGDTASSTITVVIIDDVPEARDDHESVMAGESVVGSVLVNDEHGADGKGEFEPGVTVRWDVPEGATAIENGYVIEYPNEGVLTIYNDGSYKFKSDPDADTGKLPALSYTIVDSDGDTSKAQLVIAINNKPVVGPDPGPDNPDKPDDADNPAQPSLNVSEVTVDESRLDDGTGDGTGDRTSQGSFRVDTHTEGGQLVLSFGGHKISIELDGTDSGTIIGNNSFNTQYGTFTVTGASNGVVNYTYTLNSAYADNVDEQGRNTVANAEQIKISLTDNVGNDKASGTIGVNIIDDVPEIMLNPLDTEPHPTEIRGSGLFTYGADWVSGETGTQKITLEFGCGGTKIKDVAGSWDETTQSYTFEIPEQGEYTGGQLILTPAGEQGGNFTFVYTPKNSISLNSTDSELNYDFKFTVTDNDGDNAEASISTTIKPTQVNLIIDPDKPTEDNPEPDPKPFDPYTIPENGVVPDGEVEKVQDVDNIIIGSNTEMVMPHITQNMVFLYDLAGSCSSVPVAEKPAGVEREELKLNNDQVATEYAYIDLDGKRYFKGQEYNNQNEVGNKYFDYTDLYNSMLNTIKYVKDAYEHIQPNSSLNVLLGGFDLKIEAAAEFRITCDADGNKSISVVNFISESPKLGKDDKGNVFLEDPDPKKTTGIIDLDTGYSAVWTLNNDKIDDDLALVFAGFQNSIVYNLSTAFSEYFCGFTYTATNIDNALGLATGWLAGKTETAEKNGNTVVNKTFLFGDGGGTAHTESITESIGDGIQGYFNNFRGTLGPNYGYNLNTVSDYWVGDRTNGHWATSEDNTRSFSWEDVGWEYGKFAVVKVPAINAKGEDVDGYIVVNHIGLVCGTTDISNSDPSQLKYLVDKNQYENNTAGNIAGYKEAVPVVMDWDNDKGCFVPQLSNKGDSPNHYEPGEGKDDRDTTDVDSQNEGIATAKNLKDISTITVIQFGANIGDDLKDYPSLGSDGNPDIIDMTTQEWNYLPIEIKKREPKIVDDKANGNEGDDILFGDSLASDIQMKDDEGNYNRDLAEQHNQETLRELARGVDDRIDDNSSWADVAAVIWANSDAIANELDIRSFHGGNDIVIGGADHDLLFGMGGKDLLIGDGELKSAESLVDILRSIDPSLDVNEKASSIVNTIGQLNETQLDEFASRLDQLETSSDDGNDKLYGGNGDDVLLGFGGNDYLSGGNGADYLFGGAGNDKLYGGDGNDYLNGGADKDEMYGDAGNDTLLGGSGDDTLFGGDGDDYLNGGADRDEMYGGAGNDLIVMDSNDYLVDGGDGLDIVLVGMDFDGRLDDMLANFHKKGTDAFDPNKPMVNDVEVMIKGIDAGDITSMKDLEKYGITIGKEDGKNTLSLDGKKWTANEDGKSYSNGDGLIIETNNMSETSSATDNTEVITLQIQSESGGA